MSTALPLRPTLALALLATVGAAASLPASAATVSKSAMASPSNVCTGALPTYEGNIRKRPLAVVNESGAVAFVTCGGTWFTDEPSIGYYVEMNFRNRNSDPVTFNCTGVWGSETDAPGSARYFTKSITIPASGTSFETWHAYQGFDTNRPFSVSCALPSNVAIGNYYSHGEVDVGQ